VKMCRITGTDENKSKGECIDERAGFDKV